VEAAAPLSSRAAAMQEITSIRNILIVAVQAIESVLRGDPQPVECS
jgi:hypothetical protein